MVCEMVNRIERRTEFNQTKGKKKKCVRFGEEVQHIRFVTIEVLLFVGVKWS